MSPRKESPSATKQLVLIGVLMVLALLLWQSGDLSSNSIDDELDDDKDYLENSSQANLVTHKKSHYVNSENVTVKLWKWSHQKKNIMYIKIPKTGGTTLAESLSRLANHSQWTFAKPINQARVDTCGPEDEAEASFNRMVMANHGSRLGIFALHACFRPFMTNRKYWAQARSPVTITLMRHPFAHYISKYRYAQVCCERDWAWCEAYCPKNAVGDRLPLTHTRFNEIACLSDRCNEQRFYMGAGASSKILDNYALVMVLERLDECLAILKTKVGVPFQALPYMRENQNLLAKTPNFTIQYRKQLQNSVLKLDMDLYNAAVTRIDVILRDWTETERKTFDQTLARLRQENEKLSATCGKQCSALPSLTKERRQCYHSCTENFVDKLGDD